MSTVDEYREEALMYDKEAKGYFIVSAVVLLLFFAGLVITLFFQFVVQINLPVNELIIYIGLSILLLIALWLNKKGKENAMYSASASKAMQDEYNRGSW